MEKHEVVVFFNSLFRFYRFYFIAYFWYTLIPLSLLYAQAFTIDNASHSNSHKYLNIVTISTAFPGIIHEIYKFIKQPKFYFRNRTNIIDLLGSACYISNFVLQLIYNERNTAVIKIYSLTLLVVFIKTLKDLSIFDRFRLVSYSILVIVQDVLTFLFLIIIAIFNFGNIFYVSRFYNADYIYEDCDNKDCQPRTF